MKKALKIALILLALTLVRNHLPYYYSNDKTVDLASFRKATAAVNQGTWYSTSTR